MRRILLVCNDVVGKNMAGPGIRYWEFSRILGRRFEVILALPPFVPAVDLPQRDECPASVRVCRDLRDFRRLVHQCDVVVTLAVVLMHYPFLGELDKPLVLDMYDPFLLENLQSQAGAGLLARLNSYESYLDGLQAQLRSGDFFMCANEKQRDYWLGMLSATGRVNPYTYGDDPTLRQLIDVVPFGLPTGPPEHLRPVLKGAHKGIGRDDKVILWGGGIWEWLDAPTLIRAMARVSERRSDVKLFFMGVERPNLGATGVKPVDHAKALSKELGLYDKHVFFNDWVAYEERQNYLLEADIGATLHLDHIETRFSFRTRVLDYLWASLPVISTTGDVLSNVLAKEGLARLVAPGDADGVARTILSMLSDPDPRADRESAFRRVAARYQWDVVSQPLVRFCANPYLAPDRSYVSQTAPLRGMTRWGRLFSRARRALQLGGLSGFLTVGVEYLRWRTRQIELFRGRRGH